MIAIQVLQRPTTHVTLLWPIFTNAGSLGLPHRWWTPAKPCARLAGLMKECHLFQKFLKNSPLLLNLKETGCVSAVLSC